MDMGFHVSIAGRKGFLKAIEEADRFNLTAIQAFAKSPRSWKLRELGSEETENFRQAYAKSPIRTSAIHSSYLVNLGATGELWHKSVQSLTDDLCKAQLLGIDYVVLHPGSQDRHQIKKGILQAIKQSRSKTKILVENAAGGENRFGRKLEDLAWLTENTPVGICIDTCHAFAAGYSLHKDPVGFIDQLDSLIGLDKIPLFHFNDSKGGFASRLDQHASLLEGNIHTALKHFMKYPRLQDKAFIIEVPSEKFEHNLTIFHDWQRGG
jgi:deoxyribonuclease-4